jgi:DNA-binding beta-propeller fold protein YncE
MKKSAMVVLSLLAVALVAVALPASPAQARDKDAARGRIVVANRGSGSISIIDARTYELIETLPLPGGGEPMYVVYTPAKNRVFVGDRANDRLVVYRAQDFSLEGTVPVGAGVFHMWADPQSEQLWVAADVDDTFTVVDPKTLEVLATVPIPADLAAMGAHPHDVILDPTRDYAYATLLGLAGPEDYVVQFSTETFQELGRAAVGKDPHLSLARQDGQLYVPSQGGNAVYVLNRETLALIRQIPVPGAHGAGMTRNGKIFYTTNLPGGGIDGLFAIDTRSNTVIGSSDTPFAVPHNIALTPNGKTLFVTHSGPNDKVTIYDASRQNPVPVYAGAVTVGQNPFGLTYVP